MTAEAVTYSVNPRQRRGLLASALCVAEHRRWSTCHHLVVASGTALRCRPLLHPSPGRGPGLTESESALRTSITTSLLSLITSPRHQRPSSTAPHHRSHTPATPHQAGRMTAGAVTYSVNPRQRRGLLASALCVAEHRRWSTCHHRHHIKQTGDSRRYALRRCATSPEKHPIKTFFVRENHQWIPRSTRLCRFLVRTVTLNSKVKIKNSQIQRVSGLKSAQFAKHIP